MPMINPPTKITRLYPRQGCRRSISQIVHHGKGMQGSSGGCGRCLMRFCVHGLGEQRLGGWIA